jgi:hypothetical protein
MKSILSTSVFAAVISNCYSKSLKSCTGDCQIAQKPLDSPRMYGVMEEKKLWWAQEENEGKIGVASSTGPSPCIDGFAGEYPCSLVDLSSFVSLADLGSNGEGNDIW